MNKGRMEAFSDGVLAIIITIMVLPLATALGRGVKGKASVLIYLAAIPLAFKRAWIAVALYVLVALMWIAPDRRIEKVLPR